MKRVWVVIRSAIAVSLWCALIFGGAEALASEGDTEQQPQQRTQSKSGLEVTIYPILVRAPIYGATINLPAIPSVPSTPGGGTGSGGDDGSAVSNSTDLELNGAALVGVELQAERWFAELNGLWAALAAHREVPRVAVDTRTRFFDGRGGVRFGHGLAATVGFRRVSVDLDATLNRSNPDGALQASTTATLWDPLVGIDWRGRLGSRWIINANVEGGGFGVGTDWDFSEAVRANWRVARHVDLRVGYALLQYKLTIAEVTVGPFQRKLVSKQTLNGPEFGIGIVF
jgi:hypothetical protein